LSDFPVNTAFEERVFSLVSSQWTKDRNSLREKTIYSILQAGLKNWM